MLLQRLSVSACRADEGRIGMSARLFPFRQPNWNALDIGTVLDQDIVGEIRKCSDLVPGAPIAIVQDDSDIDIAVRMVIAACSAPE